MSTTEVEVVDDYETVARVALMIADAAEALSTVLAGVADMLAGVVVRPGSQSDQGPNLRQSPRFRIGHHLLPMVFDCTLEFRRDAHRHRHDRPVDVVQGG